MTRGRSSSDQSVDTPVLNDIGRPWPLKKSETFAHRCPKLSGGGFLKIARTINRKVSNKDQKEESSGIYEQNPKVYLYQQQQYQQQQDTSFRTQLHTDDSLEDDWAKNNQILHSEPRQPNADLLLRHCKSEKLRKNVSLPDMNADYSKDGCEPLVTRETSPVNLFLPGQATNRSRSGSRPKVLPHHFITTAMSTEPITATNIDEWQREASSQEQDSRPQTPARPPSRSMHKHLHDHQVPCSDQLVHHQQCEHFSKHQVLSEDSLSGAMESQPLVGNKDLPPIPLGQTPAFQLCTRGRRKTEGGDSDGFLPPVLHIASEPLKRKESKGLIPQDVLKNMDPKDVQKAIKDTVIASRIYKVMSSEQLVGLRKEQDDLEQFIETMNLHATTRKMDQIVQKTQEAMWRLMAIQRLLLQHEGAILNAGLRRLDNENRELSRTVIQLDTARDQEKEEKIKWKQEHNRLKFQSILFPSTPILEESQSKSSENNDQMSQKYLTQLASMEQYMKELNDDILQKDEMLVELGDQLQAVKGWADDFQGSIQGRRTTPEEGYQPNSNENLQLQLLDLQSAVELELKDMDIQVQEMKSKVDMLRVASHSPASPASDDDTRPDSQLNRMIRDEQRQKRRDSPTWRTKGHSKQGSDLQMVLRESLLELDHQIRLDLKQGACASRPSSTSTSATTFSADSFNTTLSRNSSNRSCSSPLSRSYSSASSAVGLCDPILKLNIQLEDSSQELALSPSDEDAAAEDKNEEIQRLHTMVNEMKEIVKRRSANIEAQ
ncbi:hypothetical protein BGZ65_007160 [Modicella reniformis]|uniref:Uncharacterized protein n=1 Tax=Modicella reniformis TaxID=1440133 RepID=A0A9P6JGW6_9FUNG|nr:hypothetical protein BGZ65_007160 [Modicella reniformis]